MKVVYADVLIITNFILSALFLTLTGKLTHSSIKTHRLVLAGFIGSSASLLILADGMGTAASVGITLIKLLITAAEISVCFSTLKLFRVLKLGGIYFIINLLFAGVCTAVWELTDGKLVYVKNYSVYFDVSLGTLIAVTIAVYVIVALWEMLQSRCFDKNRIYKVSAELGGKNFTVCGVADTGNRLVDPYYGKPVAVFYSDDIFFHLDIENERSLSDNKLHIIPCDTVNGQGVIYATAPVEICITDGKTSKNALVCAGIVRSGSRPPKCIFDPKILL